MDQPVREPWHEEVPVVDRRHVDGEVLSSSRADNPRLMTRREFVLGTAAGAVAVAGAPLFAFAGDSTTKPADISELSRAVGKLLESSPHNRIPGTETRVYDAPVFGVSSAQDPSTAS